MQFTSPKLNITFSINKFSSLVAERTKNIGRYGAAEAFAYYLNNQDQLSGDTELKDFMLFYAKHFINSSSQWSQDIFALYASNCKKNALFLEIGGADGFTHSNTYSLENHYGWEGTLVEPDPYQFKQLRASRSKSLLVNAAISPNDKDEMLRLRIAGQLSALEGHEGKDMHLATRLSRKKFTKTNAISLTKLLSEKKYDYFSLDIECAELAILRSIKWETILKPSALTIEHAFREDDKRDIIDILKTHGYIECFANHDWLRRGDIWAVCNE